MAKRGRPTKLTPDLANEICRRIGEGESLRAICRDDQMPAISTVITWALGQTEESERIGFPAQYARAREVRSELYADEVVYFADERGEDPQRSKLQVDTRKWVASRLLPKTYGDKKSHELSGPGGGPIQTEDKTVDLSKLSDATLRKVLKELDNDK